MLRTATNQRRQPDTFPVLCLALSSQNDSDIPKSLSTNDLRLMVFRARNSVIRKCNCCKELTL